MRKRNLKKEGANDDFYFNYSSVRPGKNNAGVRNRKQRHKSEKKKSDLPDSNQRPKDIWRGNPTTVLRSTN